MQSILTTLSLLLPLALAQVEIDARFYYDTGCDNFATGCTNLAENTCCAVSEGGTILYSSGDFYNTAGGMGVNIIGNFYSIQGDVDNDCNIVTCGNINYQVCCEADTALSGAGYAIQASKKNRRTATAVADSYMWIEEDKSYYISKSNSTKLSAITAMHTLRDYTNMASFFKTHADVVKSEKENIGKRATPKL